jgi:hypothetical protein
MHQHTQDLLRNKGNRPAEDVHEVGKDVWVRSIVVLLDVQGVVLELDDGPLVVVDVSVVGC